MDCGRSQPSDTKLELAQTEWTLYRLACAASTVLGSDLLLCAIYPSRVPTLLPSTPPVSPATTAPAVLVMALPLGVHPLPVCCPTSTQSPQRLDSSWGLSLTSRALSPPRPLSVVPQMDTGVSCHLLPDPQPGPTSPGGCPEGCAVQAGSLLFLALRLPPTAACSLSPVKALSGAKARLCPSCPCCRLLGLSVPRTP